METGSAHTTDVETEDGVEEGEVRGSSCTGAGNAPVSEEELESKYVDSDTTSCCDCHKTYRKGGFSCEQTGKKCRCRTAGQLCTINCGSGAKCECIHSGNTREQPNTARIVTRASSTGGAATAVGKEHGQEAVIREVGKALGATLHELNAMLTEQRELDAALPEQRARILSAGKKGTAEVITAIEVDSESEGRSISSVDGYGEMPDRRDSKEREVFSSISAKKGKSTPQSQRRPIHNSRHAQTPTSVRSSASKPSHAKQSDVVRSAAEDARQDDERARQQRGWQRWGTAAAQMMKQLAARSAEVMRQLIASTEDNKRRWQEQLDGMCAGWTEMGMEIDLSRPESVTVLALVTTLCESLGKQATEVTRLSKENEELKKSMQLTQEQQRKHAELVQQVRVELSVLRQQGKQSYSGAAQREDAKTSNSSAVRTQPTATLPPRPEERDASRQSHGTIAASAASAPTSHRQQSTTTTATVKNLNTSKRSGKWLLWGRKWAVDDSALSEVEQRSTIFTIKQQSDWHSWEATSRLQDGKSEAERLVFGAYLDRCHREYRVAHSSVKTAIRKKLFNLLVEKVEVVSSDQRMRANQAVIVWKTARVREIAMTEGWYRALNDDQERIQMWWNGRSSEWRSAANNAGDSRSQPQPQQQQPPSRTVQHEDGGGWKTVHYGRPQKVVEEQRRQAPVLPPHGQRLRYVPPVVVQPPPPTASAPPPPPPPPPPSPPPPIHQPEQRQPEQAQEVIPNISHWQLPYTSNLPATNPPPQLWPMPQPPTSFFPQAPAPLPIPQLYQPYQPPINEQRQHMIQHFQHPHQLPLPGWWGQNFPVGGLAY